MLHEISDPYLIFTLKHENVGDPSEGQAQLYDLRFCRLIGYVPYVDDPRRFANILFQFHLMTNNKRQALANASFNPSCYRKIHITV